MSNKILSFNNIFYTILKSCLLGSVHAAFCKGIVERPIDLVTFQMSNGPRNCTPAPMGSCEFTTHFRL